MVKACFDAVELAGGQIDVVGVDGGLDFVDADAAAGQCIGIDLDAHRVFLRAEDLHLRDAADRGDALRHHGFGEFVDCVDGQRGGAEPRKKIG